MRLPDFLIVGAMKAGTTSLATWLGAHPDVFMPRQKEVHFFDAQWARGTSWYAEQFADAPAGALIGEATPAYMVNKDYLDRMVSVVPNARLVVVLREPTTRAWSHYNHIVALGDEQRSFAECLGSELATDPNDWRTSGMLLARGRYLSQLRNITARFDRSQLHVGLFDDLVAHPHDFYAEVCRFLGVRDDVRPPEVGQDFNPRAVVRHRRLASVVRRTTTSRALPPTLTRRMRGAAEHRPRNGPLPADLEGLLTAYFRPFNAELAAWLGRDLSVWNSDGPNGRAGGEG